MEKENLMKMSESELADYLDKSIYNNSHIGNPNFKDILGYFRILQLQLNHIKARADMGKFFMIAMCKAIPKKQSDIIIKEVNRLKKEDDKRILDEIKD